MLRMVPSRHLETNAMTILTQNVIALVSNVSESNPWFEFKEGADVCQMSMTHNAT